MNKPRLSFWQIWNMSFGFFGIQFGWALQLNNMSVIYEKLGSKPDAIPLLWIAAPLTGLIVQPIIGSMSDRTWNRMGRRRPYFLTGAILASIALFLMPDSQEIANYFGGAVGHISTRFVPYITGTAMAVTLLWILDASNNISMEPFRAFVADKLNVNQRTAGFVMQSFFIGVGATLAGILPYCLRNYFGVTGETAGHIPLTIKYAFQIGAVAYLLAVIWTVVASKEYPPEDMEEFQRKRREKRGIKAGLTEIFSAIAKMPQTMKQLAVVQFFTWLGLFCMWLFFVPAVARHVFGATDPKSALYTEGAEWGSLSASIYSVVCFAIAFLLPFLARKTSRKTVHSLALVCGGLGLLSLYLIKTPALVPLTMVGVGIAWASILSMPYAILSGALPPERMGVYMGVFNFFIVLPEILQALTFGWIVRNVFGEDNHNAPLYIVLIGGTFLLIAALLVIRVQDVAEGVPEAEVIRGDEAEPILVQESAQPVPSTGLIDEK